MNSGIIADDLQESSLVVAARASGYLLRQQLLVLGSVGVLEVDLGAGDHDPDEDVVAGVCQGRGVVQLRRVVHSWVSNNRRYMSPKE